MHGDNSRCDKAEEDEQEEENYSTWVWKWFEGETVRVKNVTFMVSEKISDIEYLSAIFGTIGIFMTFYVFSFVVSCAYLCR
jgi:hypothetical protein